MPRRRCLALATVLLVPVLAAPQALETVPLGEGTRLVTVTLPLAEAVSVAWLGDGGTVHSEVAPAVAGLALLEEALSGEGPLPPVVAVTGPLRPDEVRRLAASVASGRPSAPVPATPTVVLSEGGVERRLGAPGAPAEVRLVLPLPPAGDPLRPAAEVLAELLPGSVGEGLPPLAVRRHAGVVELRLVTDPELAEMHLDRLRLELERLAASPPDDPEAVEAAAQRLTAARLAELERHPEGAELVARAWRAGGEAAVRQALFGYAAVGRRLVVEAARRWLAVHPGAAELRLPPQALNPRFATPPRVETLPGGTVVAVLERPAAVLAAVCMRPALDPDPDGSRTATVLARVAAALREGWPRPAVVRVARDPVRLELAGPPDGYAELLEALAGALRRVGRDAEPVPEAAGPRARALRLMAVLLGISGPGPLTPAALLEPSNLVVGVVASDGEAAAEAAAKLLGGRGLAGGRPRAVDLPAAPRRRVATAGDRSAVVVALPEPGTAGAAAEVAARLLAARLADAGLEVSLVRAVGPGGPARLLVVEGEGELPALEAGLEAAWSGATAPPGEEVLAAVRRRAAAEEAARWSGAMGRAALAAAVAAGGRPWVAPSRVAMQSLAVAPGEVAAALAAWSELRELPTTGAGPLPVSSLPLPPAP